jgi:chromosome segregation ATPase
VRDVEKTLSKSLEDEAKVAQQVASDQEVIAFLDSRVQELERNERKLLSELKATNEELVRTKNQNSKKTTVLGDMLQFERERSTENEKEFKATKKLLVKEVKHCRSQLTALQAERDGYREQNERLRKAVFTNGASHGSPVRDDRY